MTNIKIILSQSQYITRTIHNRMITNDVIIASHCVASFTIRPAAKSKKSLI